METFSQRLKDLEARSMDRQRIKPIEISQRMDFAADIGMERCMERFRVEKQYRLSVTCYAEFWSDDEHLVFQKQESERLLLEHLYSDLLPVLHDLRRTIHLGRKAEALETIKGLLNTIEMRR